MDKKYFAFLIMQSFY